MSESNPVQLPQVLIVSAAVSEGALLAERVARFGYRVDCQAATLEAACAAVEAHAPDIVVVILPPGAVAYGAAAVRSLTALGHPVLFVLGPEDEEALQREGIAGSSACVPRSASDDELRVALAAAFLGHDARRAVREMEDRFFEVSVDMLCFLGFDGHFQRLNPAWERTLGFTIDELRARPFIEFVHPDDRERTLAQNVEVRTGGRALGFENRYLCRDGRYRWFRWNAAPDTGRGVIYSVARDVTVEKEAHAEREALVRQLQAALAEVKVLRTILPLCSYCRRIRDDEGGWLTVETFLARQNDAEFSHGICPSCMTSVVEPDLEQLEQTLGTLEPRRRD